jgi:eukaryotic-like serine/threonine-protein kinase
MARRARLTYHRGMGASALPSLAPGVVIAGRYEIVDHVGSGGMGDVYEVEHRLLGRRFALKRLAPDLTGDGAMVERFLREARAAAATHHPGVVEVVDLGFAEDGWPYLVMERLVGETVRERLRRSRLGEDLAIHVGLTVAGALGAAHAEGVIHRDVKPENLYLCAPAPGEIGPPRVKVLDFGLAILTGGDRTDLRLTQSGAVMGTPLYMSPEQARGHDVDPRTDLYSLGAVLYEMVTGRPPFAAEAYSVLVAMILEDPPPPGPLATAGAGLRAVIERALAKRADERFRDAGSMRAALAALDRGEAGAGAGAGAGAAVAGGAVGNAARIVTDAPTVAARIPAPVGVVATAETLPPVTAAETPTGAATVPDAAPADAATVPLAEPPAAIADTAATGPVATAAARRVRGPWLLAGLMTIAAVAVAVAIWATRRQPTTEGPGPAASGAPATGAADGDRGWAGALERGDLAGATDQARRAELRSPGDADLAARALLLELLTDRPGAYAHAAHLDRPGAPPRLAAALAATAAMKRGDPAAGADALGDLARAAAPGGPDELLLRYARATLYRHADRFDQARTEYDVILARRPGFQPAVEGMLERLILLGDLDAARRVVDGYTAATPDSPDLELRTAELEMAEHRYHDAVARLDRIVAAGPERDPEIDELRGDLRVLLGDVDGAIAIYAQVDLPGRRAEYVAGALASAGRTREAGRVLHDAILRFPPGGKKSRLAKLVLDAALLALDQHDAALAALAAGALPAGELEAPAASARAFAAAVVARLAGAPVRPDDFPLGTASPAYVLADAWGRLDEARAAAVRAATAPAGYRLGVVATHVYPPLDLLRAEAEAGAGHDDDALTWLDEILRPRQYDPTRGTVLARALDLRARVLERDGRRGEAAAVRRELARLAAARAAP